MVESFVFESLSQSDGNLNLVMKVSNRCHFRVNGS